MAHFAKVVDGIVTSVIVAEQDFIDELEDKDLWIKTSYNTSGGVHLLNGIPLRKNYACIGYSYDQERDAFIPPKPFNSWTLNEDTCQWVSPVQYPEDGVDGIIYEWNEETTSWQLLDSQ